MVQKLFKIFYVVVVLSNEAFGTQRFVATTGVDINPGTISQPYLTITKAVSSSVAGDTIYVRGGVFSLSTTISISKNGTSSNKFYLLAYQNERPILDYSAMAVNSSNRGINLSGSYWHIKGFDIRKAGDNGMFLSGSNNVIEFCSFYENSDTGLQLGSGASNNQIINCDSYYNADPANGNADGFAPKLDVGTGNYFYGCRAWQNSDDGWDGYLRPADNVTTTLENCWCFKNGYLKDGTTSSGNGNGFKMGGGDNSNADSLRHNMILKNCLSFDNRVKGFDQNNNRGSMTLYNCTAYRNGTNYQISSSLKFGSTLTVKNCVSAGTGGVSLLASAVQATNSWMSPFVVTNADFVSVDTAGVRGARKADGSLPDITFMHLASGSDLIDAGTNVGIAYNGSAPDLGAFEYSDELPVELISFTAVSKNNGVELRWITATEVENAGFEVERTPTQPSPLQGEGSGGGWEKIGFVEGHGTTNNTKNYLFVDNNISGTVRYRLKQIDRNGNFKYSQEIMISQKSQMTAQKFMLGQNFPNPFNPVTMIQYVVGTNARSSSNNLHGWASVPTTLKIYDALGREVATLVDEVKDAGMYSVEYDGSTLPSGVYFYKLQSESFSDCKKMILLK